MNATRSYVLASVLFMPMLFGGCRPKHAPPVRVSDGTVVLLRSGVTNAAFVFVVPRHSSVEAVDYTWYLRSDGKTTFEPNNPAVVTGNVKGAKSIAFGPFKIDWSGASPEAGWLYYPSRVGFVKMPWGKWCTFTIPCGTSMAITTERDITKIDSRDPRWEFKK